MNVHEDTVLVDTETETLVVGMHSLEQQLMLMMLMIMMMICVYVAAVAVAVVAVDVDMVGRGICAREEEESDWQRYYLLQQFDGSWLHSPVETAVMERDTSFAFAIFALWPHYDL